VQLAGEHETARTRLLRAARLPAVRAVAGALALATAVTGISTAAAGGSAAAKPGLITTITTVAPDGAAAAVIAAARTHLGDKYVFGADGPSTWDCSGLTSLLWSTIGKVTAIPRTARLQQAWATPVPASQVLPGDLYFFGTPATHVGIVIGAGWVLDASFSAGKVVLRQLWTTTNITFGRVPRPGAVPVTGAAPTTALTTTAPATTAPVTTPPVTTAPVTTAPAKSVTPTATPTTTTSVAAANPVPGIPGDTSFVTAAKALVGAAYQIGGAGPSYDDGALIAAAWHQAGQGLLPLDRNALAARSTPVTRADLRPGDLLIYGKTNSVWHVGIYVGHDLMIDASRIKGRVMLRRPLTSPDRWFGRLH
jgi:cell wall-associated NlpC family hydrolase